MVNGAKYLNKPLNWPPHLIRGLENVNTLHPIYSICHIPFNLYLINYPGLSERVGEGKKKEEGGRGGRERRDRLSKYLLLGLMSDKNVYCLSDKNIP